jgi:hypothetical protein
VILLAQIIDYKLNVAGLREHLIILRKHPPREKCIHIRTLLNQY